MKKLLALAVLLVAIAGHAEDSPLVKAAKENGGPKKKTTKKAITNADVKKSSVKSSAPAGAKAAPKVETPPVPMPPAIADQNKLIHARAEAQKRADAAQIKVSDLDKELDRLEQSYYAENDPNYRDKTIAARFEQTKLQLETARKELADARDALEKLQPSITHEK